MICPACQHPNPDENNFCGRCGTNLQNNRNDSNHELIAQTLHHSPNVPQDHYNVEFSPELAELDRQIPLIAASGTDRRHNVPDHLRQQLRDTIDQMERRNRAEEHQSAQAAAPAAAHTVNHAYEDFGTRPNSIPENPTSDIPPSSTASNSYLDMTSKNADSTSAMRLSGPSFLGLGDAGTVEFAEDKPERSHTRRNLALLMLLILCGLCAAQWKSLRDFGLEYIHNGSVSLLTLKKQVPAAKSAAGEPDNSRQIDSGAASSIASGSKPDIEVAPLNSDLKTVQNQTQPSSPPNTSTADMPSVTTSSATHENVTLPRSTPSAMSALANANSKSSLAPKPSEGRKKSPPVNKSQPGESELRQAEAATSPEVQGILLWKATKMGNPDAPVRLAEMYISGRGVSQNCEQAIILLRSAASHQNARARGKIGALYATGQCVPKSIVEAYRWMSMALEANPSSEWTVKYRQSLWSQMTRDEKLQAARR